MAEKLTEEQERLLDEWSDPETGGTMGRPEREALRSALATISAQREEIERLRRNYKQLGEAYEKESWLQTTEKPGPYISYDEYAKAQARIKELEAERDEWRTRCDSLTKGNTTCTQCRLSDSEALAGLRSERDDLKRQLEETQAEVQRLVQERERLVLGRLETVRVERVKREAAEQQLARLREAAKAAVDAWDTFEAQHDLECDYARGSGNCDCGFFRMEGRAKELLALLADQQEG